MYLRTRPAILPGLFYYPGPYRISLYIAYCPVQMFVIHEAGKESPLPEVTAYFMFSVHILGIAHMKCVKPPCQSIFCMGYNNKVDMIGHEAKCKDRKIVFRSILFYP